MPGSPPEESKKVVKIRTLRCCWSVTSLLRSTDASSGYTGLWSLREGRLGIGRGARHRARDGPRRVALPRVPASEHRLAWVRERDRCGLHALRGRRSPHRGRAEGRRARARRNRARSEEHTSELQSRENLVCSLLL